MDLGVIQELTATTPEELTEDDLVAMRASEPGPGDEKTTEKQQCQRTTDSRQSAGGSRLLRTASDFFYDTGTETTANGGRRSGTAQKHF